MNNLEKTPSPSSSHIERPKRALPFAAMVASFALEACSPEQTFGHRSDLENFPRLEVGKARTTEAGRLTYVNSRDYADIYETSNILLEQAPFPEGISECMPQLDIRYYKDSAPVRPDHPNVTSLSHDQRAALENIYSGSFRLDYFVGNLRTESVTNHAAYNRVNDGTTPDEDDILVRQQVDAVRMGYRQIDLSHLRITGHAEHAEVAETEDLSIAQGIIRLALDIRSSQNIGTVRGRFSNYSPTPADVIPVDIRRTGDDARFMSLAMTQGRAALAHIHIGEVVHLPNGGVRVMVSGDYGIEQ